MRAMNLMAAGIALAVLPLPAHSQPVPAPVAARAQLRADTAQTPAVINSALYEEVESASSGRSLSSSVLKGAWVGALTGGTAGFLGTVFLLHTGCDLSLPVSINGSPMKDRGCSAVGGQLRAAFGWGLPLGAATGAILGAGTGALVHAFHRSGPAAPAPGPDGL